ncbi:putative Ig domain-containing protein [Hahella aquimaris]|uniref:putative Ig domain-containing protein n=1 Tax=Hahella sp. HNIBRBA332 TaxID=3015983 RepID=UPI00273B07C3|nr:putative Ig domain-containing protein [Hahella sp. HNIBRBA332]WLQ12349.1 putative Ig domain-containing protein [Hahella sp. HNIBRBA332]
MSGINTTQFPQINWRRKLMLAAPAMLVAHLAQASSTPSPYQLNVRVQTEETVQVYDNPPTSSTASIGSQPQGATGIIVAGKKYPSSVGPVWYLIDYDTGEDGWTLATSLTEISEPLGQPANKYSMVSDTPQVISWPITKAYPGVEYNTRLGVVGGRYPYYFMLDQKPSGMTIDPRSGEISWTPSSQLEGQTFSVQVAIYDSNQEAASQSFTVEVTKSGFRFVSPNGSDSSGDGTQAAPWKSISYGISESNADDILYIKGGNYTEVFQYEEDKANKLIAYPGETPVIDFNFEEATTARGKFGVIDGLEIKNCVTYCIKLSASNPDWLFRRNHMHTLYDATDKGNPSFIYYGDSRKSAERIIIQDNEFHDLFDRGSGIHGDIISNTHGSSSALFNVHYALVEDNIAHDIDGFGFRDKDSSYKNTLRGNLAYNVKYGLGVLSQEYSYSVDVLYNRLAGSRYGLLVGSMVGGFGNILAQNNTILGGVGHDGGTPTGGANSVQMRNNIIDDIGGRTLPYNCCDAKENEYWTSDLFIRDFNLIHSSSVYVAGKWNGKFTETRWKNAGFDINSLFTDPLLTDYNNQNYTPLPNSPVCGAASDGSDIGAVPCN